jgi:manganese/zinc/iron transport system permease protein
MATVAGVLFVLAFVLSPRYGVLSRIAHLRNMRQELGQRLLVTHLEGSHGAATRDELRERFRWTPASERSIVRGAIANELVTRSSTGSLELTPQGRELANESTLG